jgi:hypothetical protein
MRTFLLLVCLLAITGIGVFSQKHATREALPNPLVFYPQKWLPDLPEEILEKKVEMGRDTTPILTEWEGRFFNAIYGFSDKNIDLRGKKVGFLKGSSGTVKSNKERFFASIFPLSSCDSSADSGLRSEVERRFRPQIVCYLLSPNQAGNIDRYDAAIVIECKQDLTVRQVIKRLNKNR